MNKPRPNTTREALIAEVLGDLDGLLDRVEALPGRIGAAEAQLTATVAALADASDKYRMAVTAFNEQAKAELTEYLERKAGEITAKTVEEQRVAMQEAARLAFRSEATDRVAVLAKTPARANEAKPRPWVRLMEIGVASVLSGLTVGLVLLYLKAH